VIPSYNSNSSESVDIRIIEDKTVDFKNELLELRLQVQQLRETIDYLNRERSRLKSDIEQLKSMIRKN
jgi:chromosome segregation ATPase